jgi:hypothetical protein
LRASLETIGQGDQSPSWQRLCDLRRQQIEVWKKSEGSQPALFELRDDCRPRADRTVAGRYREPSLLDRV